MTALDPAQVAAEIIGCRESQFVPGRCEEHDHHYDPPKVWPCSRLDAATEVIRAAMEQAWDAGETAGRLFPDTNPYAVKP